MKLETVIEYPDGVSGCYEFTDGIQLFWTEGRGGFVVEGGLGLWPNDGNPEMEMIERTKAAMEQHDGSTPVPIQFATMSQFWRQNHIRHLREAFQSPHPGKYSLSELANELEKEMK